MSGLQGFSDYLKSREDTQPQPQEQARPAPPPSGVLSAPAQPPSPSPLQGVAAPEPIKDLAEERPRDVTSIFNDPKAQVDAALGMIEALRAQEPTPPQLEIVSRQTGIPVSVLKNAPPHMIDIHMERPDVRRALEAAIETRQRIIADAEAALVLRGELPAMAASEQALARLGMEWRAPYAQPQMIPENEPGAITFGQGMLNSVGRGFEFGRSAINLAAANREVQTAMDLQKTIGQVILDSFTAPVAEARARAEERGQVGLLPTELTATFVVDALTGVMWDVPSRLWSRLTTSPEDAAEIADEAARRMSAAIYHYRSATDIPLSDVASSFADQLDAISPDAGLVDSAVALISAMGSNPAGASAFFAEVVGEQAIPMGAQIAASAFTRRPIIGIGTGVAATYGQEAYRLPVQMLRDDFGIDVLGDPEAPQKLLTNPEALRAVEEFGQARGVPIAVAQLLSLGVAQRATQGGGSRLRETLGVAAGQFVFDFTGEALAMLGSEGRIVWTEALIEGLAGTVVDTPIDLVTTSTDIISARRDEAKLRSFLETGQEISGNLRGMDPTALNKAAEILGDRMEREGIDRVYVDAEALNRFNQDNPTMEVAKTLGISPEALAEALDEGADIEISSRTFMRHILGREGFEALIQHTRLDPDGPKAGEVDDIDATIEQSIEEQLSAAEQRFAANGVPAEQLVKLQDDVDQITRDVADQLRGTGRFTEGQVQALAETTAKRYAARAVRARVEGADTDALSLYLEDNVRIQGQRPDAAPALDQALMESTAVGYTSERIDYLISRLSYSMDRRTKGYVAFVDPNDFVNQQAPGYADSIRARAGKLNKAALKREFQTPFLVVRADEDGGLRAVDHEGRHRMAALAASGVTRVPVVLEFREGKERAPQAKITLRGPTADAQEIVVRDAIPVTADSKAALTAAMQAEGRPAFLFQSAAPLQEQPLVIEGTGPGGRVLNRDLGRVFTERHMAAYGRALDPADPADYDVILDSLMQDYAEQTRQPDSGDAWYTDDINEAIRLTQNIYPELANDQFRDLFLTVTALLSPQQKPLGNWGNAIYALRSWKETGRLELLKPNGKQYGVRSHTTGLQLLQHLIDTMGLEGALRWVQEPHTGREMAEVRKASGLFAEKGTLAAYTPNELNLQSEALGIYMFGPKVGDFMQNSVGIDQNAVTVDLWLARSYNRYIGRLMDTPDGDLVGDVRTPTERNHIKRIVRDAAARAGIDPSAMQAALWYFEQRLYRSHGTRADSQNFSDAAAAALEERGLTDGRAAEGDQQDAGGDPGESPAAVSRRPVATEGQGPGDADLAGAVQGGRPFARQEGVSAPPLQPLPGAPRVSGEVFGPIPELVAVAEAYAATVSDRLKYRRQPTYVQVNPERGARIAQAYEDAKHDPDNPEVIRAYNALIAQTRAQYDALVAAGYEFTFFGNEDDPYNGNPWDAMRDLRDNKRMAVYSTMAGYGTDQTFDPKQHALLRDTGLVWKDQQGNDVPVLANDLFRAVHDAFGHGLEGAGFRARGEENAWQAHVRLFYGEAIKAITTETRGQNSWLNFGPYGEQNRSASLQDTVFADQKMTLLPSWTWLEGRVGQYGLPVNDDGTVTLTHFSPAQGLTELDPSYHGTGLPGDEGARKTRDGWIDRTYFGVNVGKEGGYQPEFSIGTPMYEARVPAEALYDYQQDPDALMAGVKEQAITHRRADGEHLYDWGLLTTLYEKAIFDAGYEGYFNNAPQGLTVAKFTPTPVQEVGVREPGRPAFQQAGFAGDTIVVDGVERTVFNSEGARLASTQEELENFWRWFGDSKVVDPEGRPLVVYHGTKEGGFSAFNTAGKKGKTQGTGAFFSDNLQMALSYTTTPEQVEIVDRAAVLSNPEAYNFSVGVNEEGQEYVVDPHGYEVYPTEGETGQAVLEAVVDDFFSRGWFDTISSGYYSVYLSIQEPEVVDAEGANWDNIGASPLYEVLDADGNVVGKISDLDDLDYEFGPDYSIGELLDERAEDGRTTDDIVREVRAYQPDADGVVFRDVFDSGPAGDGSESGTVYSVFKATQVKAVGNRGTFSRQDPNILSQGGARGGFTPSDLITDQNGNPVNLIEIFETGDVSTFLHESGHFWLEQLKADAGRFKGQFDKDWQTVVAWWGTRADAIRSEALDRARRAGDTQAVQRIASMSDQALSTFIARGDLRGKGHTRWVAIAMHEQFARGTEDYFRSGEAPSVDLVDAFNRFAAWLVSIYRTIQRRIGRDGLDVKFSPEVKQVLDRMLATDSEIEVVAGQYDLASLFDTAAEAGMSPEQFNAHTQRIGRAKGRAKQRLLAKHLREIERVRAEWWKSEREGMRQTVEAAIANQTPMRMLWSLAQGGLADGSSALATERLDRINKDALVQLIGKEATEALPRAGGRTIYVAGKGGASPGAIAAAFGYPDVEAMVRDLQRLGDYKEMVERELDQRMEAKHGLLQDNLAEEAVAALHGGDSAGRLLAAELAALRTTEQAIDLKFIKAYARKKMGTVPLRDLREAKYLAAEKRHAKAAGKAVRAGQRSEAYKQQFQRLVSHYMAKEARKRREQHAKDRDYLSQFKQPRKKFPAIAADYVDQIKTTLDGIDFGPRLSDRKRLQLELAAVNDWVQRKQEEDGAILEVPPLIQQKDAMTNWRDMTVDEFQTMVDWVKQLETQGRLLNKLRWGKELRDRREVLADLTERLNNLPVAMAVRARNKVASADEMSLIGKGAHHLAGLDAALLKAEFLLEQLDGEPIGPWHTAIFQPIAEAAAQKGNLMAETSAMIQQRLNALPKAVRKSMGKRVDVGNLGKPGMRFTRGNLIMLALNSGNESNLDKLIRGYKDIGWNMNEDMLKAAVNQLTKEEWELVQSIWDHAEKLWPAVENIYRRENGRSPERIEPISIETPHGTYRGGYFPMFYDSSYGGKAEQIETGDALEMFQAQHNRAGVNSSMTKERSSQFAAPVNLSIELLPQAFDRTIHFITHYDAVRSIRRIMSDPDLVQQFDGTVGPEYRKLLQSWLGAVAANLMDQPMTNKAQKAVDVLSRNTTAAILGFSYTTLAAQMMGLTVAIDRLAADTTYGPINVARVTADVVSGLAKSVSPAQRQRVMDLSGEMRHRLGQQDRDLRRMLRQSKGKSGLLPRAREVAGMLIAGLQFYMVDVPVWLASFNRALRAGEETGRAVAYADRVVRISQSGGDVKDLAAVQRDKGAMRAFTLFYSFFSVMYGVTKGLVGEVNRSPLSWVRATARVLILFTLQEIVMELIRGNGLPDLEPEDEDEDGLIKFAATRTAAGMMQTVPLARDIAAGMISDFGFSPTPVGAFGEALVKTVQNAAEAMEKLGDGEDLEEFSLNDLKPLVMGVSIGLGIPGAVQINRTLDGLQALRDEEEGWSYFDLLNGYDEAQAEE